MARGPQVQDVLDQATDLHCGSRDRSGLRANTLVSHAQAISYRTARKFRNDPSDLQRVFGPQVMDEARHMDVFRNRALPNGGRLMKAPSAYESVLRTIIEAPSYVAASASVHIRAEGFVPTLSRNAECPTPARAA